MIRIKSKKAGFRRCGVSHPAEVIEYPDERFTKEDLKTLQSEPMLVVEIVKEKKEDPPESPGEAAEAADSGKESAKTGKKGKR